MNINVWIPSLYESKGGVQVYSDYFLQALKGIMPSTECQILLKNDTTADIAHIVDSNFTYFTAGHIAPKLRTAAFGNKLVQSSIAQPPQLIISTHLNFIPVAWYLKKRKNIPYWTVAHGIEAWNIKNPLLKIALKEADRILAVSHYTRDKLLSDHPIEPSKIVVLPNTFDSSRFQITPKPQYLLEKYSLTAQQPIILTVARLAGIDRSKGYDRILEALPQIKKAIPNVHYILAGKGQDQTRIEQMIIELGLQNCVTLAGFVPDEQLCDYYNLCDMFAMPSTKEGFGIVYLEAMACGKPCLGGDRDGAIDALVNGKLGALVNPDSTAQTAETIIQILQQTYPNQLMYQPENLRHKVIEHFGFEQFQNTLSNHLTDFSRRISST
jgi:glycosyltransferase involved in cell wall biosynthesis